jgi:RNA polymerase sigma factor (sigma-70 family)
MADDVRVFTGSAANGEALAWEEVEHHARTRCDERASPTGEIHRLQPRPAAVIGAIEETYSRHRESLSRLVDSMLDSSMRRRVDPGEIVSGAFVSLLESVDRGRVQIDPSRDLFPLVLQFAIHQVHKYVEFQTRQKRSPKKEEYCEADGLAFRGETHEQIAERVDSLGGIIRKLPPDWAVVFLLRLMDFTEQEIGDILGCKRTKVKNLRAEIRRHFGEVENVLK